MTRKDKAKQKAQEEKHRRSELLKDESAIDINKRFRDGTLWIKDKKSKT